MFSKELLQGILKEIKRMPKHAQNVRQSYKQVLPHQRIAYGAHRQQYFCYFKPEIIEETKPLVVFYHGGSWLVGKPEMFTNRAQVFVEQGYSVVMPAHRKLPFHRYYSMREDMILVLKSVQKLLIDKGTPNKKIVLAGMSSGGNLAALSFFDSSIAVEAGFNSDQIAAGFFCGAPLNLAGMPDSIVLRGYADEKHTSMFQQASPISFLTAASPSKPVLVVHGSEDGLVAYSSVLTFKERLRAISPTDLTFCTLPNGSHIESVRWAGQDGEVRQIILDWFASI